MPGSKRDRIFSEWLEGHKGVLFKVVHAYARTDADREDLFQEIAVQVWQSVDAFRGESAVVTWVYRVALNTAIRWNNRSGKHQQDRVPLEVAEGLLVTSTDEHDSRLDSLYRRIAELNDVDRSLALLMLDGFSYRDMAEILGLTESHVGVKINRIKSALAERAMGSEHHES